MKTLAQIDEILGNVINQSKGVQKAETLEAAKERVRRELEAATTAPPPGLQEHVDAARRELAAARATTAPPPGLQERLQEHEKEIRDLWEKVGPRAELRRAAAEKKGMQEQFREWFEGGRGARARGRGGAGRRSGGRR